MDEIENADVPVEEQVKHIKQTPTEVLDDDGGLPQPTQNPWVVVESDPGAEG